MGHVTVTIAGRSYRMACADGEEEHLEGLAQLLDGKIRDLRGTFGEIGDQRITVMAALTFADDLAEAKRRIAGLESEKLSWLQSQGTVLPRDDWNDSVADALARAAARIEEVTRALSGGAARQADNDEPAPKIETKIAS